MNIDRTLDALRVRMKIARTVASAARWAFYASIAACLFAALRAPAWTFAALAGVPLLALLARFPSRRDAAFALDRALALDERVSTALETRRDFVVRDAERALDGRDPRRAAPVTLPREAKLLAFSLPLALLLLIVMVPGLRSAGDRSALADGAATEAKALELIAVPADFAAELKRVVVELQSGDPERIKAAASALSSLEAEMTKRAMAGGKDADALRAAAERAAASAAALGRLTGVVTMRSGSLEAKLNATQAKAAGSRSSTPSETVAAKLTPGSPLAVTAAQSATDSYNRHDWDPRYDDIVRAYYEVPK